MDARAVFIRMERRRGALFHRQQIRGDGNRRQGRQVIHIEKIRINRVMRKIDGPRQAVDNHQGGKVNRRIQSSDDQTAVAALLFNAKQQQEGRQRSRFIRRKRFDIDRSGTARPQLFCNGNRRAFRGHHNQPLHTIQGQRGRRFPDPRREENPIRGN